MSIDRQKIKYIGFYQPNCLTTEDRICCVAATSKMDYICSALVNAGYDVNIVSPSWSVNKSGYYHGKHIDISDNISVTLCPTFGVSNKIMQGLSILYSWIWLLFWMLLNVKRNEKIIVYHSLWIISPLSLAMKIKKFKIVLEVEEIYCKVYQYHPYIVKLEQNIISRADSYIFPNDIMSDIVNLSAKPHVVIYGVYEKHARHAGPAEDGKVHLVYAGIIDKHKAGAFNAVESAKYLDNSYIMHILGFGDRESLQQAIDANLTLDGCKVILHGMKTRSEYLEFMQTCHIGLSTQNADGAYADYQFPSKILSYLSLGLKVVSSGITCVTKSKIGDNITYYTEDTPAGIAEAIKSIDIKQDCNTAQIIKELDADFTNDIKNLLQ